LPKTRPLHKRLEKQRRETGKVRALILKGRQEGCSTYVTGRFYWRSTHRRGVRLFILTHEDQATQNLFGMVDRYHEHCPALVKPQTGAANAKELYFSKLDSGYKVGTAGTKDIGRSSTVQLFHGSEVAFWPHAESHIAGVLQAVPDLPGSEIVLESTANGIGNPFHQIWRMRRPGLAISCRSSCRGSGSRNIGARCLKVLPSMMRRPNIRRLTVSISGRWPGAAPK
jgi:hypothetical protein